MTLRYGDPVGVAAAERPKCWGQSYNSEDRECRGCSWQASCRDQVIRTQVNRQPAAPQQVQTPMNYYQPQQFAVPQHVPATFQPPRPPVQVAPPQPYQVTPYRPPQPQIQTQMQVPMMPLPAPQVSQQPVQMSVIDYYGRFQDPLHYSLMTAPPPYRPQMTGESFFERVAKNVALAMLEVVAMQGLLAVRQMVLPPTHTLRGAVDVTPEKKTT